MLIIFLESQSQNDIFALVQCSIHPSDTLGLSNCFDMLMKGSFRLLVKAERILKELEWNTGAVWKFYTLLKFILKVL